MKTKCAVFCVSTIDNYLRQSIIKFSDKYSYTCHIISRTQSADAPYLYQEHSKIIHYDLLDYNSYNKITLFLNLNPSVLFVSGWIEKIYLVLAYKLNNKNIPVVMSMDNHWKNSIKQIIGATLAKYILPSFFFSHVWIAGQPQKKFAKRLGFKETQILKGVCAADVLHFAEGYIPGKISKQIAFIGRLVPYKRPVELCNLFLSIPEKKRNGWKLLFIGSGESKQFIKKSTDVDIKSFLQPSELVHELKNIDVLCLPSTREHWGLVVHECCAAGKVLITSDRVGASSDFLIDNYNGFTFNSEDLDDLKSKLFDLFQMKEKEILLYQKRSIELAKKNSSEIWADKFFRLIHDHEN